MNQKAAAIIAGCNEDKKMFKCIIYSNQFTPNKVMERDLNSEEDLNIIQSVLNEKGFACEVETLYISPELWESNKAEIIESVKGLAADFEKRIEAEKTEIEEALAKKSSEVQSKTGVKNLKFYGAAALAIMVAAGITGYTIANHFDNKNVDAPKLGKPAVTMPVSPIDQKIAELKEKFAKGEMYYDITNPIEVENRVNVLISYFGKMEKGVITKSEATDFYLLINGIKPANNVDIDELMRKIQLAAAYDAKFDWREVKGQEIIANKRDSEYLDIYLKAINDWKNAAANGNKDQIKETGRELVATSFHGFILKNELDTENPEIGKVNFQNISHELQAFIVGYVGPTLNFPGLNPNDAIGAVPIMGDKINVNDLAKPIAGPHIIPAGEEGRTDNGGEEGLAQSTMIMLINDYNQGRMPECPEEIKALIESFSNQQVKILK